MGYFNYLFPYKNRQLSMQNSLTPKEFQTCFHRLALIAISNLRPDEQIHVDGHSYNVIAINQDAVTFSDGTVILQEELSTHPLTFQVAEKLHTLHPEYSDDLVYILERDPAVFRLRTQNGWVANDEICFLAGNVQYKRHCAGYSQDGSATIIADQKDLVVGGALTPVEDEPVSEFSNSLTNHHELQLQTNERQASLSNSKSRKTKNDDQLSLF